MAELLFLAAGSFLIALVLTWIVMRIALVNEMMMDRPNLRSSHTIPTPRGGGVSVVVVSSIGWLLYWKAGPDLVRALILGGLATATVGFMDDKNIVSVPVRLGVHIAAAGWAVYALGGFSHLPIGGQMLSLGPLGNLLAVVAIVWALNLFNFMDGIDGIAASEAVFVTAAGAFLTLHRSSPSFIPSASFIVMGASLGFLMWNWPPAKIFMGDVASGYLGYVIAVLALAASRENSAMIFVWLILGGVFFVDATVTLVRRVSRGERVYTAHRSHAYQWLTRRWSSHLRVTVLAWAINLFWLFPMAWLCADHSEAAFLIALVALTPLVVLAWIIGAGKPEIGSTN